MHFLFNVDRSFKKHVNVFQIIIFMVCITSIRIRSYMKQSKYRGWVRISHHNNLIDMVGRQALATINHITSIAIDYRLAGWLLQQRLPMTTPARHAGPSLKWWYNTRSVRQAKLIWQQCPGASFRVSGGRSPKDLWFQFFPEWVLRKDVWLYRPFAGSPPGFFAPLTLDDSPPPRWIKVIRHRVFRPRHFMHDDENKWLFNALLKYEIKSLGPYMYSIIQRVRDTFCFLVCFLVLECLQ